MLSPSTSERSSFVLPSIVIGISLMVAALVPSYAFYKTKSFANVITVTGSAERRITSDTSKWTSSFSRTVDVNALKDGGAQMKSDLAQIQKYLKDHGIKNDQVTVQPMSVSPICENQSSVMYDKTGSQICGKTIGYTLQQSLIVESPEVVKIKQIAQDSANAFIDAGMFFSTQSIEYYYSKLADLKLDMLTEATKDAKARAERIVESTGGTIGNVQNAGAGVFQITTVNSTEVSDYGAYDTSSLDKKVTAIVHASFTIN